MSENQVVVVNSSSLIEQATSNLLIEKSKAFNEFKEFLKNDLKDGIDFGNIPKVDKPSLFKAGGEKIQMYLGLTPQYKLLHREFIPNQKKEDKVWNETTKKYQMVETVRNYYSWEWSCELWYGDKKVAEGVGTGNSEERKWVSQYQRGENPDSLANTIMKMSKKRAFMDAIIGVSGVSDIFTQDLEDDENIKKLKVDKTTKVNKLTKANIKTIYATLGALELVKSDLDKILNEMGYLKIQDCKAEDCNTIIQKLKDLANSRNKGDK